MMFIPSKLISTVACPSSDAVILLLSQEVGFGTCRVVKDGLANSAARSRRNRTVELVELCRDVTPPARPAPPREIKNDDAKDF